MKTFQQALLIVFISLTAVVSLYAEEVIAINNFTVFPNDPLAQAVYEVAFINGVIRSIPSDAELNADVISYLKTKVQQAGTLLNFVCAQVYVNHLKDLRDGDGLDPENYYTRNNPTSGIAVFKSAASQGAQRGTKLMVGADNLGQHGAIFQCSNYIADLDSFLCLEFERSYRKLFDLELINSEDIQNPYYSFFCQSPDPALEYKEEL